MNDDAATNNPYAAPGASDVTDRAASSPLLQLQTKFRRQAEALGVAWIVMGAAGLLISQVAFRPQDRWTGIAYVVWCVCSVTGIVTGVLICFKNLAAVGSGIALCYIFGAMNLAIMNVCAIVFLLPMLFQGHRVLEFSRQLRKAMVS